MHSNAQMHPSNADSSTLSVFLGLCVISGEGFFFFFLGEQQSTSTRGAGSSGFSSCTGGFV